MDVSVSTHRVGALTTATNPANEMMKLGRGEGEGGGEEGDHEYESVDASPRIGPASPHHTSLCGLTPCWDCGCG